MQFSKIKLILLCILLALLVVFSALFITNILSKNIQKRAINSTAYRELTGNNQWPLQYVDDQLNNFLIRIVLEPGFVIQKVEYNGLIADIWSYGSYYDSNGNVQRVALPRSWYNIKTKDLFFLSTLAPSKAEWYSEKLLTERINDINTYNSNKQPLVAAYFSPDAENSNPLMLNFYETFSSLTLPVSFITTGDPSELPYDVKIGNFLPITQLAFDIEI